MNSLSAAAEHSPVLYQLTPVQRIFIRDLVMLMNIGVHEHEMRGTQRIRVSVDLLVRLEQPLRDKLKNTICYDRICTAIRELARQGHIQLVETVAERVVAICFADSRVQEASVTIEKLDVYDDADSVGVTMSAVRTATASARAV